MKSRVERFNNIYEDNTDVDRTDKNQKVYEDTYYYDEHEIETITNLYETREIDMAKLKKIIDEEKKDKKEDYKEMVNIETLDDDEDTEDKYDINSMLEKKKEERISDELLERYHKLNDKDFEELQRLSINRSQKLVDDKETIQDLTTKIQTGEIEIRNLLNTINMTKALIQEGKIEDIVEEKKEEASPLDLLRDLKPDGETIIVEAQAKEEVVEQDLKLNVKDEKKIKEKLSYLDEDKTSNEAEFDDSFYSKSLKFYKEDFDDDDLPPMKKKKKRNLSTIIMIIVIIVIVILLAAIGIYVFNNYLK